MNDGSHALKTELYDALVNAFPEQFGADLHAGYWDTTLPPTASPPRGRGPDDRHLIQPLTHPELVADARVQAMIECTRLRDLPAVRHVIMIAERAFPRTPRDRPSMIPDN